MNTATKFLSGLALGGLIGAGLALMFAPSSGEVLRIQIRDEIDRVQSDVRQAAVDRRAELEEQLAALRQPRPIGEE
jgi:gas vesicle protein